MEGAEEIGRSFTSWTVIGVGFASIILGFLAWYTLKRVGIIAMALGVVLILWGGNMGS